MRKSELLALLSTFQDGEIVLVETKRGKTFTLTSVGASFEHQPVGMKEVEITYVLRIEPV